MRGRGKGQDDVHQEGAALQQKRQQLHLAKVTNVLSVGWVGYCLGEVSAIKYPREGTGKVPLFTKEQVSQLAEFNRQDRVNIEFESFKKEVSRVMRT